MTTPLTWLRPGERGRVETFLSREQLQMEAAPCPPAFKYGGSGARFEARSMNYTVREAYDDSVRVTFSANRGNYVDRLDMMILLDFALKAIPVYSC